jgi:hypothetical protein
MTSARIELIALSLTAQMRIAGEPGCKATQYRPAVEAAIRLAHQYHREALALAHRREWDRLAAQTAAQYRVPTGPDTFKTANRFAPNWRG